MSKSLAFEMKIEGLNGQFAKLAELESELHSLKETIKEFKKEGKDFSELIIAQEKLKVNVREYRKEISAATRDWQKSKEEQRSLHNSQVAIVQTEREWYKENKKLLIEEKRLQKEKAEARKRDFQEAIAVEKREEKRRHEENKILLKQEEEQRKRMAAQRKADVQQAINQNEIQKKSLVGMRLELERMKKEYYLLSEAQRSSAAGAAMLQRVQDQDRAVTTIERSTGFYGRNVGNYPQAMGMIASNMSAGIIGSGPTMGAVAAAGVAAQAIQRIISLNSSLDGLQANVRKTTGLNTQAVEELTEGLKKVDTSTQLQDLLKISEIAGRFGVQGRKGVEDFTKSVNLLNVALGDEFGGGVEQITDEVAKLSNVIYGATTDGEVMADRFLKLGNTINVLANTSAATAGEITDVATRIGGMARAVGFTDAEVLGLSTSILELGIDVERGATAFNTLNSRMRSNIEGFSKATGIAKDELREMLDTKPMEAMNMVIAKLVENSAGSPTSLLASLKKLNIAGAGVSEIFLKFSQGMDTVTKNIDNANGAIGNTNSLLAEQANMMDSLPAQWDRLINKLSNAFVNSTWQDGLKSAVQDMGDFVDILSKGDGLAYVLDKLGAKAFEGLEIGRGFFGPNSAGFRPSDYFNRRASSIQNRASSADRAAAYDPSGFFGLPKSNQPQPFPNRLPSNQDNTNADKEAADIKKVTKEITAQVGSVAWLNDEISKLKKQMDSTTDETLITKYAAQIEKLEKQLEQFTLKAQQRKNKKFLEGYDGIVPLDTIGAEVGDGINTVVSHVGKNAAADLDKSTKNTLDSISETMRDFQEEAQRNRQQELERQVIEQQNKKDFYISNTASTIDSLTQLWDTYYQKQAEKELILLDRQHEKRLKQAQGNATLEKALSEQFEREKADIERKARKKSQQMAILQANINGALAITNIWANTVDPTPFQGFKAAATVFAGLQTALQIAVIKSQGFADGGFTGNGIMPADHTGRRVAGVVHEKEYVAPTSQIERYPQLFQFLENDRLGFGKAFAMGGFTSQLPPMPMPNLQQRQSLTDEDVHRIADAVRIGSLLGAQEANRVAERQQVVNENLTR